MGIEIQFYVQGDSESSCPAEGDVSLANVGSPNLLTRGNAWAISLTMRNTKSEELSRVCFSSNTDGTDDNLLYRFFISLLLCFLKTL